MFLSFTKLLLRKIFFGRSKQHLLIIAIFGLFLSAFSLLVLQATMGGLQNGLIARSKKIEGSGVIELTSQSKEIGQKIIKDLEEHKIQGLGEYEIELLLRNGDIVYSAIMHGIEEISSSPPAFLNSSSRDGLILGYELGRKLQAQLGSKLELISPSHTNILFGEVPRSVSDEVSDFVAFELPEHDAFHGWVRVGLIQNLVRKLAWDRVRLYGDYDKDIIIKKIIPKYQGHVRYIPWEKSHSTLLWAFKLETSVMVFLFIGMSLLVAVAITSGLVIFFGKIKNDLLSLWILGASEKHLKQFNRYFLLLISLFSTGLGIALALVFLFLLDRSELMIMPEIFVERRIPVSYGMREVLISFFIPFSIAIVFGLYTLKMFFNDEQNYSQLLRARTQ